MTSEKVLKTASVFGVLAVSIGAFGAHGAVGGGWLGGMENMVHSAWFMVPHDAT